MIKRLENLNTKRLGAIFAGVISLVLVTYAFAMPSSAATVGSDPLGWAQNQQAACQAVINKGGLSRADQTYFSECVRHAQQEINALSAATPSPTTSPTGGAPSSSPTDSPSPSPTPTTSEPTPTPSPTATNPAKLKCMDVPSACGYPDLTNTGVPSGTILISSGSVTLTSGVYTNLSIHGCVSVTGTNVTLTKSFISGCTGAYAVRLDNDAANFTISDSEIIMQGDQKGIVFRGYTARRVKVTGIGDCFGPGNNTLVVDSYCENGPGNSPKRAPTYGPEPSWCGSGAHWDGAEVGDTRSAVLRHNTFRLPCGQTGAIDVSDWAGPTTGVVIDNNLLAGGSWTVYCGSPTTGVTLTNNRFSRWYWPGGGSANDTEATQGYCWSATRSGNVWDETGLPDMP